MSWPEAFVTGISQNVLVPVYLIEPVTMATADSQPGGGTVALSSARVPGYTNVIDARSVSFGIQALDLRTMTWSGGAWSFDCVCGTNAQRDALLPLERGALIQIRLGLFGWAEADYQTLTLGVVMRPPQWAGPRAHIEVWDLLTLFRTRIVRSSYPALFGYLNEASAMTELSVDHTAGDGSISLLDNTGMQADGDTDTHLFWVQPDSGDPVLLAGTYLSGTTYSVTTSGQYGTTDGDAATGATVWSAPLVTGSPAELARKVLTSTGLGTNGDLDTLPESWGYGLGEAHIDADDMADWDTLLGPATGAHAWTWIQAAGSAGVWAAPASMEDGLKYFTTALSQAGMWLCMRQGQVVLRGLQDVWNAASPTESGLTLTDRDIQGWRCSTGWRASDQPFEWLKVRVSTGTDASDPAGRDENNTWPIQNIMELDLTNWVWTNEASQREAYRDRIKEWAVRIPEVLHLRLAGWRALQLTAGDLVRVNSQVLRGRFTGTSTLDGSALWMVSSIKNCAPKPAVELTLLCPPQSDEDEAP